MLWNYKSKKNTNRRRNGGHSILNQKEYDAAMSRLNDRYLMESTMTNKDYLRDKKAIELEYLKTKFNSNA